MSKPDRLAYGIMVSGIAVGVLLGGRAGWICGVIGVLAGSGLLAWIITSSAKHGDSDGVGSVEAYSAHEKTEVLVLVREAHARALPDNDSNFDVFLSAWLTSQTEFDLAIRNCHLTVVLSDNSVRLGQWICGDLEKWHLGKEREESDLWDTHVKSAREQLTELNTAEPLKIGVPRQGWLHFHLRSITPEEFRTRPMELSIEDSLAHRHATSLNCPRHLPGKVWPIRGRKAQKAVADA
jgi:hypothetical protein